MTENLNTSFETVNLIQLQADFFTELDRKGRSKNTLKNYKTDLDCFNNYLVAEQKTFDISSFSIPQVIEYGQFLEDKYKSDNSRRRRVQALRIFFDFLVEKSLFSSNPVRKIPTSPKFLDVPRPTPFIDVKTLWVHLLEESVSQTKMNKLIAKRNQVVMLLIFGGALKVSDLSKLKRSQIFLATPESEDESRVLITHPKRDDYTVILPKIFSRAYQEYIKLLDASKSESNIQFEELLFNANPYRILSGGLSPRGLEVVFEELRKKLMITLTPKSLRQACVFKWLQQKRSDTLIKEWMGVAPSYSLKLYKDHIEQHIYNDSFLEELFDNYLLKQ